MVTAFVRTILLYFIIMLGLRLMGKRQVSQLQNSELVVTLLLSELAVLPIQEEEKSLWVGLAPMAALVACELLVSVLMLKSGRFRQLVCGSPTVVIERGQVLQKAMRRLMSDKTCFVIAHRLSTIRNADLILVVKDGQVVEQGTHDSLMAKNGFYAEMFNAQFS